MGPEAGIKNGEPKLPSEATEALFPVSRNVAGMKELSSGPEDFCDANVAMPMLRCQSCDGGLAMPILR